MTPLTQQLEDKKKKLKVIEDDIVNCKIIKKSVVSYLYKGSDDEKYYKQCIYDKKRLQSEIAILEQAIAEMQKQRQEILKLIKQEISKDAYSYTFECRLNDFLKNGLKKQLNQPKTESCGRIFNDFIFGERICGRFEDLKHSDHIILCPDCKKENSKQ